jgi:hypothetical protein
LVLIQGCVVLFGGELSSPDDFALTNETWVYRTDTKAIEQLRAQGQYNVHKPNIQCGLMHAQL